MESRQIQFTENRPAKVLLVDDEPSHRFLTREMLTNSGYEVFEAENGQIAIEIAEQENPDTILLDVMMPDIDGFETCRRLKLNEVTCNIPVIMISALGDRSNRLEGISVGAADFIVKPIDMADMLVRVEHAASAKRQLEELSADRERLAASESQRGGLLAKVAHDLRSPLSAMTGNLQLLQMVAGEKLTDEETGFLQHSLDASDTLLKQIESLTESDETLIN